MKGSIGIGYKVIFRSKINNNYNDKKAQYGRENK
ncbi:hypothetical protein Megpolyxen_01837 (plasmid) [Candidatus Megaera polyxenophila]|nr:hypothetical protein Megpolyxen_01837 [Candidatus Megaera polyxenophila]